MRTINLYLAALCLLVFSSCEEVIELDLDNTSPQLVIEATLDAGTQQVSVFISRSNDFYDNSAPESVAGASVILEHEDGTVYALTENTPGNYTAEDVAALPGFSFVITADVGAESYTASASVPVPVALSEVQILEGGGPPFGDDEGDIALTARWNDPAGSNQFYRIKTYTNGVFNPGSYTVVNDEFAGDGEAQTIPIQSQFEEENTITVELLSTDKEYYDYFFQVAAIAGEGPNATTPYNPTGNFSGDVLGYFGIYFTSEIEIEI